MSTTQGVFGNIKTYSGAPITVQGIFGSVPTSLYKPVETFVGSVYLGVPLVLWPHKVYSQLQVSVQSVTISTILKVDGLGFPEVPPVYSNPAPAITSTGIEYTGDFTVSAWVDHNPVDTGMVFNYYYNNELGIGLALNYNWGGGFAPSELVMFTETIAAPDSWVGTGITIPEGLHHIVTMVDSSEGKFRVIVNDSQDSGWLDHNRGTLIWEAFTPLNLFIGQRGNSSLIYGGDITNVNVYDYIVSDITISSLYNA